MPDDPSLGASDAGSAVADSAASSQADTTSTQSSATTSADVTPQGTVATPDVAASSMTATPAQLSQLDLIRQEHGIDLAGQFADDAALRKTFVHQRQLIGKRNQMAEIGQAVAPYWQQFQTWMAQQQQGGAQQAPAQQPASQPSGPWNPPDWNQAYNQWLDPTTGMPMEGTPLDVRNAFEKRRAYFDQWRNDLVWDAPKAFKPFFDQFRQELMQEVQRGSQAREQEMHLKAEAEQLVSQEPWIFATDPQTGQRYVNEFGQPIHSQAGQIFINHLYQVQATGIRDQKAAMNYAKLLTMQQLGYFAQPQQQAAAPAAAVRQPNANGGRAPNGHRVQPANGNGAHQTLKERLLANLEAEGVAVPDVMP